MHAIVCWESIGNKNGGALKTRDVTCSVRLSLVARNAPTWREVLMAYKVAGRQSSALLSYLRSNSLFHSFRAGESLTECLSLLFIYSWPQPIRMRPPAKAIRHMSSDYSLG